MKCPIKPQPVVVINGGGGIDMQEAEEISEAFKRGASDCVKHECAWWVRPYTTENILTEGMCAIKALGGNVVIKV